MLIPALVLAFLLGGWPTGSVPGQSGGAIGSSQPSYHWVEPHPGPGARPWPFYGDPKVGPRDVVCRPAEWVYVGPYRGWYPGTCWTRRAYRRTDY